MSLTSSLDTNEETEIDQSEFYALADESTTNMSDYSTCPLPQFLPTPSTLLNRHYNELEPPIPEEKAEPSFMEKLVTDNYSEGLNFYTKGRVYISQDKGTSSKMSLDFNYNSFAPSNSATYYEERSNYFWPTSYENKDSNQDLTTFFKDAEDYPIT